MGGTCINMEADEALVTFFKSSGSQPVLRLPLGGTRVAVESHP